MLSLAPDAHTRSFIAYNLACMEALRKRHQEALQALADAVNGGYTDGSKRTTDEDLRPLREGQTSSNWSPR
jgi:hypothetical protein